MYSQWSRLAVCAQATTLSCQYGTCKLPTSNSERYDRKWLSKNVVLCTNKPVRKKKNYRSTFFNILFGACYETKSAPTDASYATRKFSSVSTTSASIPRDAIRKVPTSKTRLLFLNDDPSFYKSRCSEIFIQYYIPNLSRLDLNFYNLHFFLHDRYDGSLFSRIINLHLYFFAKVLIRLKVICNEN